MRAASTVGISITSLGGPLACRPGRCLPVRPPLRRNDTGDRLGPDVGNHLPNRSRRHDAAVGGHPAWPSIKNRLIQRAIGAAVTPAAVDETRTDPAECTATVTT